MTEPPLSPPDTSIASLASWVCQISGHQFTDTATLEQAFRHKSVSATSNYERLEFLGDRILGVIVSTHLYTLFPQADQGELTARFHALTHEGYLSSIADKCKLAPYIAYHGAEDVISRPSVKGDIIESLISALYLDGGIEAARGFIMSHWVFDTVMPDNLEQNPKSALQEWAAAQKLGLPEYQLVEKTGSDHQPQFTIEVKLADYPAVQARGSNIKSAERQAARQLLASLLKSSSR